MPTTLATMHHAKANATGRWAVVLPHGHPSHRERVHNLQTLLNNCCNVAGNDGGICKVRSAYLKLGTRSDIEELPGDAE